MAAKTKTKDNTKKHIVQTKSPVTGRYTKIDRSTGTIIGQKKTKGPYKGIEIVGKKRPPRNKSKKTISKPMAEIIPKIVVNLERADRPFCHKCNVPHEIIILNHTSKKPGAQKETYRCPDCHSSGGPVMINPDLLKEGVSKWLQ